MKKLLAFLLCLMLLLPLGTSANAAGQLSLAVNGSVWSLDPLPAGLQLTTPYGQASVTAQDGQLFFTADEQTRSMPELIKDLPEQRQMEIRVLNSLVEYATSAAGRAELQELFSMLSEKLPALNNYIGWQQKEGGVLETKHTFSSILTILSHFIVNELMDSSMIGWLNQSQLNDIWQTYANDIRYWFSGLPLGIVAYLYLIRLPMNAYSSYLPEEPLTLRLYLDDAQGVQKIEVAFAMAEDGTHLDIGAALSTDGLHADLCVTYDDEPGVENTATLRIEPQDTKWIADFAFSFPSDDASAHLWGSAAYTPSGPDVLFLCDLPGEWMNMSFRLTGNKLYLTGLSGRGYDDFSLLCDWGDGNYNVDCAYDGQSYRISGTYRLIDKPKKPRSIRCTFTVYENNVLLLDGSYNGSYQRTATKSTDKITLLKETYENTLSGKIYNNAVVSAGTDEAVSIPPMISLLEFLSGRTYASQNPQSEYDFCLQYTYSSGF